MKIKLPEKQSPKAYSICTEDHKEFNGSDVMCEKLGVGVRKPLSKTETYIIKDGYTYLWEPSYDWDSNKYYSICLLYVKGKRPTTIELKTMKILS